MWLAPQTVCSLGGQHASLAQCAIVCRHSVLGGLSPWDVGLPQWWPSSSSSACIGPVPVKRRNVGSAASGQGAGRPVLPRTTPRRVGPRACLLLSHRCHCGCRCSLLGLVVTPKAGQRGEEALSSVQGRPWLAQMSRCLTQSGWLWLTAQRGSSRVRGEESLPPRPSRPKNCSAHSGGGR